MMIMHIEGTAIDFHQLIEYSLSPILVVEKNGEILYCNKASIRLFDLPSADQLLYKNMFTFIAPEFHSFCQERLDNVIEKKEMAELVEKKMIKADGKLVDVEVMAVPFYLEEKVLAQIIIQDITARKAAESRLNSHEKLVSIGQIAAGIAHEVKNPLTAVQGFLQLFKETHTHPYLNTMELELEKALDTLKNLLHVAKPDLQNEPMVPIHLCKELNSLVFLFQDRMYDVEMELDLQDSDKPIVGKRNLFLKAFFNLLKNSFEAIKDKGKVRIEHHHKNGYIHIKVSDTGVGIPQEKLTMLGTPFFTSKSEGTGLGLTQVYTTIHEHGGSIFVESTVGEGTTFHIQLPVKVNERDSAIKAL